MRTLILLMLTVIVFSCAREKSDEKPLTQAKKPKGKSAEQYHKEFQLSLQKGDTAEAIKVLQRFQKVYPTDVASQGAMITLQAQSGEIDRKEALARLQKLFDKSPTPAVEQMYLSFIMYNGTPTEVVAGLDSLIARYPERAIFHTRRAHTLMEMELYDEAIVSFTNAIRYEPDNLYLRADRNLAVYKKGDTKVACMAWKIPGGGSQAYFEQYCKWQDFEKVWDEFIRNPGKQTAQEVQSILSKHHDSMASPDEKLSAHILGSWVQLSRKTPGNETIMGIGFQLIKVLKDAQNYELRCELAESIEIAPKLFLTQVRSNRYIFDDLNEIVGALGKDVMKDKTTQQNEIAKRIMALNSVNSTDLIRTRGECLLALEKKRERLMRP